MIKEEYYKWLCGFILTSRRRHYRRLLKFLHGVVFTYTVKFDRNRFEDGINLRHRFAYETKYADSEVQIVMGDDPCSLLEMMIALSIRCEENIMADPEFGNRTDKWFWSMIDTSGLDKLTDNIFASQEAEYITNRILNRTYGPCGEGGLFYVENCGCDLREVEIWYQLYKYLEQYFEEQEKYGC